MNIKELAQSIVEIFVASIPMLVAVVSLFKNGNKNIAKQIETFELSNRNQNDSLDKKMLGRFSAIIAENKENNDNTIGRVENFIDKYEIKFDQIHENNKFMVKQNELQIVLNKQLIELIIDILKIDPKALQSGLYEKISRKYNLTKEELENYPEYLDSDINILKDAMGRLLNTIGEDNFHNLLEEIGYEKTKAKKL